MCGLAEIFLNLGAQVSGSDLSENSNTLRLKKLGAVVFKGHHEDNLKACDVLVYSSAVPLENPEIQKALAQKTPLISRAEALAELMRLKRGVAIAGSHGKTTTTSLVASIFIQAGLDPTVSLGGRLDVIQSTAVLGRGEWVVAEADESDGSFVKLTPELGIVTNIDNDHLDYFKTFENLQKSFLAFSDRIPFYGSLVVWGDDPEMREVFKNYHKKILFYGLHDENDFQIQGSSGFYQIFKNHRNQKNFLGDLNLPLPGIHNALNALAAVTLSLQAGISFQDIKGGIEKFKGVDRRFQRIGQAAGVQVYDDYGHHPTEIRATLAAFNEKFPKEKLVVLFQPHRYSRTQSCWNDFLTAFQLADVVYITDIYPASELPLPNINSQKLVQALNHSNAKFISKDQDRVKFFVDALQPNSVFLTLGAGDVTRLSSAILTGLKAKELSLPL